MGINFSETISLSHYFPFNYLNGSKTIGVDQYGILLREHFDTYPLFNNWHGIYTEGKGENIKIRPSIEEKRSRCLSVINRQADTWSLSHNKFVEVNIHDNFSYDAKVRVSGKNPIANVYVDAFDNDIKIVKWGYSNAATERLDEWIQLKNKLSIDDERIKYIRLRISGSGEGYFSFDDIIFKKERPQ